MDYGLPQDYYKKKFDPKLQRRRRYHEYEDSRYGLGVPSFASIPVGVSVAGLKLPDPQIFFTEPEMKEVKTYTHKSNNITINISGDPDKIDQVILALKTIIDDDE